MRMKMVLATTLLIAAAVAPSHAQLCCSCSLDATERGLLIPADDPLSPLGSFTVTVKNDACIPIPNAVVEIILGGQNDGKTHLCPSAIIEKNTDANGVATFNLPGGGCYKGADAFVIRANGVTIRMYRVVVSPDYAAYDNVGQPAKWDLRVGLSDFVSFAYAYGASGPSCHDYDNTGTTDIGDFALFGRFWSDASAGCR